ncbi:hypothetical protein H072_1697 [Dactylellina haptotyla CBS 200.50]|uniref:Sialidase domain-containing protein n=1 Tax=Dactylellina haptotyla (strain CBS 200.50) TaxID=1284197 RepID=S8C9B6_DACHA|nr:hypothetical protein H072_1697 [Dactylellina haptotyla CBS 200.50]
MGIFLRRGIIIPPNHPLFGFLYGDLRIMATPGRRLVESKTSSIPTDLSKSKIDIYASTDNGKTWKYVSNVAIGGVAIPNNGLTQIWEPFLMYNPRNRKLVCYYSDQRANTTHGQNLVHQSTADLKKWGPIIDDVAYPISTDRPGMPTTAKLPNGDYIYAYKYGGGPGFSTYQFPVYYRLSKGPEAFSPTPGIQLNTPDGVVQNGSPYVVWTPYGIRETWDAMVSHCNPRDKELYQKSDGSGGKWILIAGAGKLPPSTNNDVTISVIDLAQYKT